MRRHCVGSPPVRADREAAGARAGDDRRYGDRRRGRRTAALCATRRSIDRAKLTRYSFSVDRTTDDTSSVLTWPRKAGRETLWCQTPTAPMTHGSPNSAPVPSRDFTCIVSTRTPKRRKVKGESYNDWPRNTAGEQSSLSRCDPISPEPDSFWTSASAVNWRWCRSRHVSRPAIMGISVRLPDRWLPAGTNAARLLS